MRIIAALSCLLLVSGSAVAQTPQDLDVACAVTASAEIAIHPRGSAERDAAVIVWTFYLGRLTARDDRTFWSAVIKGRLAELRQRARSESLYLKCMDFYTAKIEDR